MPRRSRTRRRARASPLASPSAKERRWVSLMNRWPCGNISKLLLAASPRDDSIKAKHSIRIGSGSERTPAAAAVAIATAVGTSSPCPCAITESTASCGSRVAASTSVKTSAAPYFPSLVPPPSPAPIPRRPAIASRSADTSAARSPSASIRAARSSTFSHSSQFRSFAPVGRDVPLLSGLAHSNLHMSRALRHQPGAGRRMRIRPGSTTTIAATRSSPARVVSARTSICTNVGAASTLGARARTTP